MRQGVVVVDDVDDVTGPDLIAGEREQSIREGITIWGGGGDLIAAEYVDVVAIGDDESGSSSGCGDSGGAGIIGGVRTADPVDGKVWRCSLKPA